MTFSHRSATVGKHGGARDGGQRGWQLGWRGLLGAALCAPTLAFAPGAVAQADGTCTTSNGQATCTFSYTGGAQSWTAPAGVTQATFTLYGAEGGGNIGTAGRGAEVTATLPVSTGTDYQVNVGQAGVVNGGATFGGGASGGGDSSSGGGASDLRVPAADGSYPLANRLLVAGGGGGNGAAGVANASNADATGGTGGNAGANGSNGVAVTGYGTTLSGGGGGRAGTGSGGGAGGSGGAVTGNSTCWDPDGEPILESGTNGNPGGDGSLGAGGSGGYYGRAYYDGGSVGGGGGGGYYGGGGGGGGAGDDCINSGAGGGGGGSSYTGGVSGATVTDGVKAPSGTPNGEIVISYALPASVTTVVVPSGSPYGQPAAFTATVSAGSGVGTPTGTVQFQIDGVNFGSPVALVNGEVGSAATSSLGAGQHTITAVYSGDANFAPSRGSRTVTIRQAPLTVTANNQTTAYGAAIPALTYAVTDFVNGDTAAVLSGAPSLSTTAGSTSAPGAYPITISQGTLTAANYTFIFRPRMLTVTPASQTITFPALTSTGTIVDGSPPLALDATASSGLRVSYQATGPCTVAGSTLTLIGVGACQVTAQQPGNADYEAAPAVSQTLTISQPADTTPPTASPSQSPAPNAAGWNTSAVTVNWNWADNTGGSGIDPNHCTQSSTSSGEGVMTLTATCDDKAGNVGKASYTVKVDSTAPTGSVSIVAGPPTQAIATVQDATSGLQSIQVTEASNATYTIPAFTPGTTQPIEVVFTKVDQSQGASFGLLVTDQAGNQASIDPADVSLDRATGKPIGTTLTGIQGYEQTLTLQNGTPGITHLDVAVNGQAVAVPSLAAGATVTLDIGAALHPGATNTITLTPTGKPGGSAEIVVSGSAP